MITLWLHHRCLFTVQFSQSAAFSLDIYDSAVIVSFVTVFIF